ncbi:MAG: hypothetical protein K8S23_05375 [Candidatus Cloacimonetes bacterium]|nr:hypothetical protein [Candidatus Cloacimonadota bacterium]
MEVIKEMIAIGFTEYEAKAYYNLLKKNSFTASELSKISNVPRTKIYSVLENIIDKGACLEIPGKIKKYRAISPEIAFKKIKEQLEEKASMIDMVSQLLLPIFEMKSHDNDPMDYIEVYRDKNSVLKRLEQLERNAKFEILTMSKPPFVFEITDFDHQKINSNVDYRYLEELTTPISNYKFEHWQKLIGSGINVKMTNKLPIKIIIYDRHTLVLGLQDHVPGKESLTNMVIAHKALSDTLAEIFEMYWNKAVTFSEYCEIEKNNLPNNIDYMYQNTKKNGNLL